MLIIKVIILHDESCVRVKCIIFNHANKKTPALSKAQS